MIGEFVLVRCDRSGVHMGTLVAAQGRCVELKDARILHHWKSANTLYEVALNGVGAGSRISDPVSRTVLFDAIQLHFPTAKARESLEKSRWAKSI